MSFSRLAKDTVSLLKKNGEKTDGIKASVQKGKIFIFRSNILIETGDLIQRKMSNGGEETYEVIDPGFNEGLRGNSGHYQMDVKKVTPHADSLAKDSKNSKNVNTGTKTIFISHAAEDAILAKAIKTQIDNVFQEKIDVFVSSIPGKIKPGSDWLEKIVGNLIENSAFIVLVTPYSEKRPFVWFEIGFAWLRRQNKTCEIYAICAPPVEPGELAEPLRRLQATSLASEPQTKVFFDNLTKQFGMGNLSTLEFNKIANSLPSYPSQIIQTEDIDISDEAKEFCHDRLFKIKSGNTPVTLYDGPKYVLHLIPFGSFKPATNFDLSEYYKNSKSLHLIKGKDSPMGGKLNFDGFVSHRGHKPAHEYTQLFRNGIIEAVSMDYNPKAENNISSGIDRNYENNITNAISEYLEIQQKLGITPPVFIILTLLGVKGVHFGYIDSFDRMFEPLSGSVPFTEDDLMLPEVILTNFDNSKIEQQMRQVFDIVLNAAGLPNKEIT